MEAETYVLIHDIGSGAWEWDRVVNCLREENLHVVAFDMKASGGDCTNITDVKDLKDYAEPLLNYLYFAESKSILVAHGYGGVCATLAMKMCPEKISRVVYVNGFMPDKCGSINTNLKKFFKSYPPCWDDTTVMPSSRGNIFTFGPNFIRNHLCQLASPEDKEEVVKKMRPGIFFQEDDGKLPCECIRMSAIICTEDKFLSVTFQEDEVKELLIKPKFLQAADHMPMISRAHELSQLIAS